MKKLRAMVFLSFGICTIAMAEGDPEAGKQLSMSCAACHGVDGNSALPINPSLAGQHERYIVKQLEAFKLAAQTGGEEGRNNPVMNGMALPLTKQQMEDIAAYFASQTPKPGSTPEDVVEKGTALYRGGDVEQGVTACIACHGPRGNGNALANFPDISGQHPEYIESQLKAFRSGDRKDDLNGMMRDVSMQLSDEDISILSRYLSGLH